MAKMFLAAYRFPNSDTSLVASHRSSFPKLRLSGLGCRWHVHNVPRGQPANDDDRYIVFLGNVAGESLRLIIQSSDHFVRADERRCTNGIPQPFQTVAFASGIRP